MSRSWLLFLEDIERASRKILRFTEGLDLAAFTSQEMAYDAVLRNLEIIGEATKAIPPGICADYPGIDWRGISGLRDILAHAYFGLDSDTLWDIIKNKVPKLLEEIQKIRRDHPA
jgi:uncharacterized protein with HEPN domain